METKYLCRTHLEDVVKIESTNSMLSNHKTGRWSKADFIAVLQSKDYCGLVVVEKKKVLGFVIYCLMVDKIHICNLAVHKGYLCQGVGTRILDKMKSKLVRRKIMEIDIRESNLYAQLWLRDRDFKATGVVRRWYEDTDEDAYKFRYSI